MKTKPRITSILKATTLDYSLPGIQTFRLSDLNLPPNLDFQLPNNLRLGHLAEKIVAELIRSSANYEVLYENIQVVEDGKTIGEIDFIIAEKNTRQLTHLELAYKFYLFDPTISSDPIKNWIGPNRNDSLKQKIEKLRNKQFPLLYHRGTKSALSDLAIDDAAQALCLLAELFIPYGYTAKLHPVFQKAIKGYYLDFETFVKLDDSAKSYYLPAKTEWGMNPSENENWLNFNDIKKLVSTSIEEKRARLCWQKQEDSYLTFFIVWW